MFVLISIGVMLVFARPVTGFVNRHPSVKMLALAFLLLQSSDWVRDHGFGVLNWLPEMPLWLYVLLGLLLLDLIGAYLAHLVEHKVKPLWMIHLVHHTDHEVDTTTANRHHPLESMIRFVFTLCGVFIAGTPIGIVMLYQSLSLVATQFSHANIRLPRKTPEPGLCGRGNIG